MPLANFLRAGRFLKSVASSHSFKPDCPPNLDGFAWANLACFLLTNGTRYRRANRRAGAGAAGLESTTSNSNWNEPGAVGVPEISPLESSVSPSGSAPELTESVSGGVPPESESCAENGAPTVPAGRGFTLGSGCAVEPSGRETTRGFEATGAMSMESRILISWGI